ncbi:hypothetical protein [Photobacterium lipolyticum]|uniref:Uncharacterized protein n=1 Tax=Photobacterium lipolyticum TaxID=266810 RepID=A0A2T3N190_9GAMM|nr:hypothetical protein [Photobacterium lipolyticum]PSW05964.1 hypothetical protein C9I89_05430 [Photobacterium lipolyticum]
MKRNIILISLLFSAVLIPVAAKAYSTTVFPEHQAIVQKFSNTIKFPIYSTHSILPELSTYIVKLEMAGYVLNNRRVGLTAKLTKVKYEAAIGWAKV